MNAIEEKIIQLWTEGLSTAKIAAEIGMSKNSVCGRIFRMRERGVTIPPKKIGQRDTAPKPRVQGVRKPRVRLKTPFIDGFDKAKRFQPKQAAHSLNIGFWKLKSDSCRYVVNDGRPENFIFCGAPRERGPYCEEHAKICYNVPTYEQRREMKKAARFR